MTYSPGSRRSAEVTPPGRCASGAAARRSPACSNDLAISPPPARGARSLILLAFVVLAGVVGGPSPASSTRAAASRPASLGVHPRRRAAQRATGQETSPGIVLLVGGPAGGLERARAGDGRGARAGIRASPTPRRPASPRTAAARWSPARCAPAPTRRTSPTRRWPPSRAAATSPSAAPRSRTSRSARRSRRTSRARSCSPSRCWLPALAAVLPRPRGAPAAGRRRHDRARDVPRADRRQPGLRPQRVRAQPRDRARARAGDRLHAVPRHPLPRGARRTGRSRTPRCARRWPPPGARSRSPPPPSPPRSRR